MIWGENPRPYLNDKEAAIPPVPPAGPPRPQPRHLLGHLLAAQPEHAALSIEGVVG
ncbi:MAG: hypothetical protein GAK36_00168 [Pseudomonas sp.]|nr:MAG: hypothetical protein GAK36_00168 [Pseudomonas sp.]